MKVIKQFQVLISTPSDILDEVEIINRVIKSFNNSLGKSNGVNILSVNWRDNSYPESGNKPQELLNEQIVNDSDAVIAIFWTRFGSPTTKFDSGTEEEIEKMIESGKQVFLYFCERKVDINSIDYSQWEKIQNFKKKYSEKGLYSIYKDLDDFEKKLFNHLVLHFLDLKSGSSSNYEISSDRKSNLIIKSYNDKDNQITDNLNYYSYDYSNSILFEDFLDEIKKSIQMINSINMQKESIRNDFGFAKKLNLTLASKEEIKFDKKDILLVENFINTNSLHKLDHKWTEIGDLYVSRSHIPDANLQYSSHLNGKEEEKEKYRNIKKLFIKIKQYIGFKDFFTKLDSYCVLTLILENNGNTYDEDINITLFVKRDTIILPDKFVVPSSTIVSEIDGLLPSILVHSKTHTIECYPIEKSISIPKPYLGGLYSTRSNEDEIKSYKSDLKSTFSYDFYQEEDFDIIKFNLKYLKHNDKLFFPTNLFFNTELNELKYEITSKHFPSIIKGEIEIK